MAVSCRARQIEALKRMLNLNEPVTKSSIAEPVWKVLIYDRFGQDIISPLLNVKELRELGITLHLQLHSDRDAIPEAPAIYFVFPTDENIQRICQDFRNNLYEAYYLNFISAISRQKLEDLATAALQTNCVTQVTKIFDQYLNFISLEDDLFTVKHDDRDSISYYGRARDKIVRAAENHGEKFQSKLAAPLSGIVYLRYGARLLCSAFELVRNITTTFTSNKKRPRTTDLLVDNNEFQSYDLESLNRPDSKDTDIERIRDALVDSLFSFLVTLGSVPIIRCPRGNAAEMVAEALDKKIRENLRDTRNSLFTTDIQSGNFSFQRPVLIILDRNVDLCTPLHHTWTYQALCHDVFDLKLNKVVVKEPLLQEPNEEIGAAPSNRSDVKKYILAYTDKFWSQHKVSPFPTVAEAIQKELDEYKTSEEEVKKLKNVMGGGNEDEEFLESHWSDSTAKLTSAVSSLPELLERKRVIDMHTNIATALLEHIKARKLDIYFETEEKIMSKSSIDKSIMEIIQDPEAGTPEDKLRLFLIYYMSGPPISPAELDQFLTALTDAGCIDCSAANYIKKWKSFLE